MKLEINVELDNAAFDSADELPRILNHLANELYLPEWTKIELNNGGLIRDINGNNVGNWKVS